MNEIFYLKQAQGISCECITSEYEIAKTILQFGLRGVDLAMYAFDDQARESFFYEHLLTDMKFLYRRTEGWSAIYRIGFLYAYFDTDKLDKYAKKGGNDTVASLSNF